MKIRVFRKILSANDVGSTGGHQGGILIPKGEKDLLGILPHLDAAVKNPDAWIECIDENGELRRFRFVYYNNKLHESKGTRNEYRLTHMTGYFKATLAREGESFEISRSENDAHYAVRILREVAEVAPPTWGKDATADSDSMRIKIRTSWRRVC
ncbi:EcoRII N-terminal effector-binding domain-containing protein [Alcanivorax sp. 1008]|uniref:EcoRII N-terminal effector-binding domain-containing protein n=1 Tax=Alcanivorax sp. 1008 TaxID=2816853 RepID=UPI001DBCF2B3|nr:EcoRII N-terminal effector-binding domain-containing protein [Alcanivorax sp. 1008]MCC1498288.1 hypothetical protein [Alcanivorax sp. 1008]